MHYYLYIRKVDQDKYEFYGSGDMKYLLELMNDYLVLCNMYGKESVEFKVTSIPLN